MVRFWTKMDKSSGPDACWPWLGGKDKDGYGKFQYFANGADKQTNVRAHRLALKLTSGGAGEVAMHSCDNPACCNPKHLSWSTVLENRADCVRKGRHASGDRSGSRTKPERLRRGQAHPNAKLTDEQVVQIRARYIPRRGVGLLAKEFGVSTSCICDVATGRTRA